MTPERRSQIRDAIRVANRNGDCGGWIAVADELLDEIDRLENDLLESFVELEEPAQP